MADAAALQAVIGGRVQGVLFRDFVFRRARALGLTGYVRNLPDGTVSVRAEGERGQLEKLVGYLGLGPPAARVTRVDVSWSEYTGKYADFSVTF